MNTVREILQINQQELERGIAGTAASWHAEFSGTSWVYLGNLDHSLSEGDILAVCSQYGEIEDLHLARDEATGKSKGFCFCKYEDARSAVLAVDNFCGIELCGRILRVDHVKNYRLPKHLLEKEEQNLASKIQPGLAYAGKELANDYSLAKGQDLFAPRSASTVERRERNENQLNDDDDSKDKNHNKDDDNTKEAKRKRKEERKQTRMEREHRKREREQKRMEREERKRKKRAERLLHDDGV